MPTLFCQRPRFGFCPSDRKKPARSTLLVGLTSRVLGGILLIVSIPAVAPGDPLFMTIDNPAQLALVGGSADFVGTITNNTAVTLSADELFMNFSGFDAAFLTIDQLLGSPNFSISSGATSPVVELFDVSMAGDAMRGKVYPIVSVSVEDVFADTSNIQSVNITATTVPEPPTAVLLVFALFPIALLASRRFLLKVR